jgi:hypothetical protein
MAQGDIQIMLKRRTMLAEDGMRSSVMFSLPPLISREILATSTIKDSVGPHAQLGETSTAYFLLYALLRFGSVLQQA